MLMLQSITIKTHRKHLPLLFLVCLLAEGSCRLLEWGGGGTGI